MNQLLQEIVSYNRRLVNTDRFREIIMLHCDCSIHTRSPSIITREERVTVGVGFV